jgi:hypothetical protein
VITVDLAAALICFAGSCHPALVGNATPPGTYQIELRRVTPPAYRGDVMVFAEDARYLWAVHRTWPGREKLYLEPAEARRSVTKGCINVEPHVYEQLRECCNGERIEIR